MTEEITSDVFYERLENTGLDEQARLGVMKLLFKYKSYSERVSLLVDGFLNAMRRERENVAFNLLRIFQTLSRRQRRPQKG